MYHFYCGQKVAVGRYDYGALEGIFNSIADKVECDINVSTFFFGAPEKPMAERAMDLVFHKATAHGFDAR